MSAFVRSLLLLAVLAAPVAQARSHALRREITQRVVAAAQKYAEAIACDVEPIRDNMVAVIEAGPPYDLDDESYVVVWTGDIGCGRGNGGPTLNVMRIEPNGQGAFYAHPSRSSPVVRFESERSGHAKNVTSAVKGRGRTLILHGDLHGPDDGVCCPSLKNRAFVMKLRQNGDWTRQDMNNGHARRADPARG